VIADPDPGIHPALDIGMFGAGTVSCPSGRTARDSLLTVGFLSGHVEELVRFHCVPRSNICDAERCAVNKITFNGVAEAGTFQFDSLNAALANYVRGDRVCAALAFDDDSGALFSNALFWMMFPKT